MAESDKLVKKIHKLVTKCDKKWQTSEKNSQASEKCHKKSQTSLKNWQTSEKSPKKWQTTKKLHKLGKKKLQTCEKKSQKVKN